MYPPITNIETPNIQEFSMKQIKKIVAAYK